MLYYTLGTFNLYCFEQSMAVPRKKKRKQILVPAKQSPNSLMQKPLSTQCHNISRPIRQMNPQFQNTKHRFWLVCESQPSHIESIMCQADPSPPNQSPPSFPNSFPYNVEGEAQFVFNKRSRDLW